MKKLFFIGISSFLLTFLFLSCSLKKDNYKKNKIIKSQISPSDFFEKNFPLKKVKSQYFINDLSYTKKDNFLKHPFYYKFITR